MTNSRSQKVKLEAFHELRVLELKESNPITITLISGSAEINGSELIMMKQLKAANFGSSAIFTWTGAEIRVEGEVFLTYNKPNPVYAAIFGITKSCFLDLADTKEIPKLWVCGELNSGKRSITKTLLNYVLRQGITPILLDLDISHNLITIPGAIAASVISKLVEPFSDIISPVLSCFVGREFLNKNSMGLYLESTSHLIETIQKLIDSVNLGRKCVIIVKCNAITDFSDLILLNDINEKLKARNFLFIGLEWAVAKLNKDLKNSSDYSFYSLPPSAAIPPLNFRSQSTLRSSLFKSYFYGSFGNLFPSSLKLKFNNFSVYKLDGNDIPSSALPKGEIMTPTPLKPKLMKVDKTLKNSILGICPLRISEEGFAYKIKGFVHVTNVDEAKQVMTLLCPSSEKIPSRKFICVDLTWLDQR